MAITRSRTKWTGTEAGDLDEYLRALATAQYPIDRTVQADCACGAPRLTLVVVGFSRRDDGVVRWITVGVRCCACGMLGAPVDWKIDYAPTEHLYNQV